MVNCNDTIQLPGIRINDQVVMTGEQGVKPATWRAAVIGAVISFLDYLARVQSRARNRHAIELLDNHMLKDVGLTRADIDQELSRPIWTGIPPRS